MNLDRELFLAYLEEDNTQRAYFRVHPLLTIDGPAAEEGNSLWPDEGCLRIVPDRAEQHTFKDRMRRLNGWCAVDLTAFNPEANKIRTNKNYHPDRGEVNRFILYSDAVHDLPGDIFYEVFSGTPEEAEAKAAESITPRFFIRNEDTVYGPVDKASPSLPDAAPEMEAVFYSIQCPDGKQHDLLCVRAEYEAMKAARPAVKPSRQPVAPAAPEAQAARPAPAVKPEPVPVEVVSEAAPAIPEEAPAPVKEPSAPAEPAAPAAPEAQPKADAPIVIGEPMQILDESLTFEETINGLDQPLSSSANLLKSSSPTPVAETARAIQPAGRLNGTPLNRSTVPVSAAQPRNRVQEVVYSQCRVVRNDPPAESLPQGANMRRIVNPVEEASIAVRKAWSNCEAREQIIDSLLALEGIQPALEHRIKRKLGVTDLQRAIQEHLHSLEAERLAILVELNKAKADVDEYRRDLIGAAVSKAAAELKALEEKKQAVENEIASLKEETDRMAAVRTDLAARIDELQGRIPEELARLLASSALCVPSFEAPVRLAPATGRTTAMDELLLRVAKVCRAADLPYDKNRVTAILLALAVSDRIGVATKAPAAAGTFMKNLALIMGWGSSFGIQSSAAQGVVTAAPVVDAAPSLLVTMLQNYAAVKGIRKIFVSDQIATQVSDPAYKLDQWPVLSMDLAQAVPEYSETGVQTVSEASLTALLDRKEIEGSEVRKVLAKALALVPPLSGQALQAMCTFVAAAAGLMDGGLSVACDWAIMLWIIPALKRTDANSEAIQIALAEYPMSLAAAQ